MPTMSHHPFLCTLGKWEETQAGYSEDQTVTLVSRGYITHVCMLDSMSTHKFFFCFFLSRVSRMALSSLKLSLAWNSIQVRLALNSYSFFLQLLTAEVTGVHHPFLRSLLPLHRVALCLKRHPGFLTHYLNWLSLSLLMGDGHVFWNHISGSQCQSLPICFLLWSVLCCRWFMFFFLSFLLQHLLLQSPLSSPFGGTTC